MWRTLKYYSRQLVYLFSSALHIWNPLLYSLCNLILIILLYTWLWCSVVAILLFTFDRFAWNWLLHMCLLLTFLFDIWLSWTYSRARVYFFYEWVQVHFDACNSFKIFRLMRCTKIIKNIYLYLYFMIAHKNVIWNVLWKFLASFNFVLNSCWILISRSTVYLPVKFHWRPRPLIGSTWHKKLPINKTMYVNICEFPQKRYSYEPLGRHVFIRSSQGSRRISMKI